MTSFWIALDVDAYAQDAPATAENSEAQPPASTPSPQPSSETVADPGEIPEGGFMGNDSFGAIPLGSGWEYVWAVYIVTWLVLSGYGLSLYLRARGKRS